MEVGPRFRNPSETTTAGLQKQKGTVAGGVPIALPTLKNYNSTQLIHYESVVMFFKFLMLYLSNFILNFVTKIKLHCYGSVTYEFNLIIPSSLGCFIF